MIATLIDNIVGYIDKENMLRGNPSVMCYAWAFVSRNGYLYTEDLITIVGGRDDNY